MARGKGKEPELDFEKSLKKLEEIVHKLEEEEISLENSLKFYAEGQALAKACERKLAEAENKIKMLTENSAGEIGEEEFEGGEGESEAGEDDEAPPVRGDKSGGEGEGEDEIPF